MNSLIKLTPDKEEAYLDFYRDWQKSGEQKVPWIIGITPEPFQAFIDFCRQQEAEEHIENGFVPSSTYFLENENGIITAAVNIRHRLNEYLMQRGGHIGYGVRPSERKKGYAKMILSLALEKTNKMGIREVLVTCDAENFASEKTILSNGGIFESSFTEDNGNVIKRFWIT